MTDDPQLAEEMNKGEAESGRSTGRFLMTPDDIKNSAADLPDAEAAEELVAAFPEENVRELAISVVRAGLEACRTGDLMCLAEVLADWVETAEELSHGSHHVDELLALREQMRQSGGASEQAVRARLGKG